jgi:alpha-soluble NSF attachment protein
MAASTSSVNEQKARDCLEQAEKAKNRWSLFGGNSKYEEAAEFYVRAANLFRVAKNFNESGRAFLLAAEMNVRTEANHEAATNCVKASNAFRKSAPDESVRCLQRAIGIYTDAGRFSLAARHQQDIAELYESQLELALAIDAYETAAEYFEGENASSAATKCLIKVAGFSAQLERYERAIEIFEHVAAHSLGNNLLKWSARKYFLQGGLCHLAHGDVVGAQRALDRYASMDTTWPTQREAKFLAAIVTAVHDVDVEAYTNAVVEYDSITKLDSWTTTMLLRIKNSIAAEDDMLGGGPSGGGGGVKLDSSTVPSSAPAESDGSADNFGHGFDDDDLT